MSEAYNLGVQLALKEVGLTKEAGPIVNLLRAIAAHPVTIGAALGATGGALSSDEESFLRRTLAGAATGGVIGAGIKYLPKYIEKMLPKHPLAKDLPWFAPSMLAPAVVSRVTPKGKR